MTKIKFNGKIYNATIDATNHCYWITVVRGKSKGLVSISAFIAEVV